MKKIVFAIAIILGLGVYLSAANREIPDLSANQALYEALTKQESTGASKGAVVVYVWQEGCRPCENVMSKFQAEGAWAYAQSKGVDIYNLDLRKDMQLHDKNSAFYTAHKVNMTPTILFFLDGRKIKFGLEDGKEHSKLIGGQITPAVFKDIINKHLL